MREPRKDRFIAYEAYKKLADAYAEQVDNKPHNAYLERPATLSLLQDVEGKRALDAGCGPGSYSEWLAEKGAEVVSIDASPKMVEHAKRRLGNRAEVRLHDLREPLVFLEDNSVDLVLAPLVMDYIEDWTPVFKEFRRILIGDGTLVFSVGHPAFEFIKDIGMRDYWSVERVEIWWRTWGEPVLVPSYRRPLQAITDPLREAGFILERLVEARPTKEYKEADPEGYEEVSRRPSFICIKAIPDPRRQ